jgi:hypothetical protein
MVYEGALESESAAHALFKINSGLGLLAQPQLGPPIPIEPLVSYLELL